MSSRNEPATIVPTRASVGAELGVLVLHDVGDRPHAGDEQQARGEDDRGVAEGEPETGTDRRSALAHELAGGVVDRGDVVGVEGVPDAEHVGGQADADPEDAGAAERGSRAARRRRRARPSRRRAAAARRPPWRRSTAVRRRTRQAASAPAAISRTSASVHPSAGTTSAMPDAAMTIMGPCRVLSAFDAAVSRVNSSRSKSNRSSTAFTSSSPWSYASGFIANTLVAAMPAGCRARSGWLESRARVSRWRS